MAEKQYRIKGKGSAREVYDGDVLVGRITRHEKDVVKTSERWRNGRLVSAEIRKVKQVTWTAVRADGSNVRWQNGKDVVRHTMRAWSSPGAWEVADG